MGAHGTIEHAGVVDDLLRVFSPAASFQRVVGGVVVGDIEDGAEVEVETEEAEDLAGEFPVLFDKVGVALVTQRLGVWRFLANETEAGNAATFLVNGDEGFDFRQVTKVVNEFTELFRRNDVPTEEDEAAGLEFLEASGRFRVEFWARDASEEELTEMIGVGHELIWESEGVGRLAEVWRCAMGRWLRELDMKSGQYDLQPGCEAVFSGLLLK